MSIAIGGGRKTINIMHGLLLLCFQSLATYSVEPKNVDQLKILNEEIMKETHTKVSRVSFNNIRLGNIQKISKHFIYR